MNDTEPAASRVVAIVGRPNVGKSSVFNRIINRRLAIVHASRGVTRDRLSAEAEWQGRRFELIDTGGLGRLAPDDETSMAMTQEIEQGVRQQAEAAIADATVVLWTVDIETGVLPQDEEVASLLRRSGRQVFVLANKADNPRLEAGLADFVQFGYPVFPVSALHGRGFEPLLQAVDQALPPGQNLTRENPLKLTFAGRPNVGKSSIINRILQNERILVSPYPGTTRDSISIPFIIGQGSFARHYLLTDTAGLRRAGKVPGPVDRLGVMRSEQSMRRADVIALVLDAEQGPTAYDKTIAMRVEEFQKSCVLIVNKWDLTHKLSKAQYRADLCQALPFCRHIPIVFASAQTGYNIRQLVEKVDAVARRSQTQLPTAVLNRVIMDAYAKVQAPLVRGRMLKIYYATQIATRPPVLRLFVNDPQRMLPAYESYLIRRLREAFDLEGVPLVLKLQARRQKNDE